MPSLTIRNIPEELLEQLRRVAADESRSVNAQTVYWLQQAARQWMNREQRAKLLRDIELLREATFRRHGLGSDSAVIIRRMRDQRGGRGH